MSFLSAPHPLVLTWLLLIVLLPSSLESQQIVFIGPKVSSSTVRKSITTTQTFGKGVSSVYLTNVDLSNSANIIFNIDLMMSTTQPVVIEIYNLKAAAGCSVYFLSSTSSIAGYRPLFVNINGLSAINGGVVIGSAVGASGYVMFPKKSRVIMQHLQLVLNAATSYPYTSITPTVVSVIIIGQLALDHCTIRLTRSTISVGIFNGAFPLRLMAVTVASFSLLLVDSVTIGISFPVHGHSLVVSDNSVVRFRGLALTCDRMCFTFEGPITVATQSAFVIDNCKLYPARQVFEVMSGLTITGGSAFLYQNNVEMVLAVGASRWSITVSGLGSSIAITNNSMGSYLAPSIAASNGAVAVAQCNFINGVVLVTLVQYVTQNFNGLTAAYDCTGRLRDSCSYPNASCMLPLTNVASVGSVSGSCCVCTLGGQEEYCLPMATPPMPVMHLFATMSPFVTGSDTLTSLHYSPTGTLRGFSVSLGSPSATWTRSLLPTQTLDTASLSKLSASREATLSLTVSLTYSRTICTVSRSVRSPTRSRSPSSSGTISSNSTTTASTSQSASFTVTDRTHSSSHARSTSETSDLTTSMNRSETRSLRASMSQSIAMTASCQRNVAVDANLSLHSAVAAAACDVALTRPSLMSNQTFAADGACFTMSSTSDGGVAVTAREALDIPYRSLVLGVSGLTDLDTVIGVVYRGIDVNFSTMMGGGTMGHYVAISNLPRGTGWLEASPYASQQLAIVVLYHCGTGGWGSANLTVGVIPVPLPFASLAVQTLTSLSVGSSVVSMGVTSPGLTTRFSTAARLLQCSDGSLDGNNSSSSSSGGILGLAIGDGDGHEYSRGALIGNAAVLGTAAVLSLAVTWAIHLLARISFTEAVFLVHFPSVLVPAFSVTLSTSLAAALDIVTASDGAGGDVVLVVVLSPLWLVYIGATYFVAWRSLSSLECVPNEEKANGKQRACVMHVIKPQWHWKAQAADAPQERSDSIKTNEAFRLMSFVLIDEVRFAWYPAFDITLSVVSAVMASIPQGDSCLPEILVILSMMVGQMLVYSILRVGSTIMLNVMTSMFLLLSLATIWVQLYLVMQEDASPQLLLLTTVTGLMLTVLMLARNVLDVILIVTALVKLAKFTWSRRQASPGEETKASSGCAIELENIRGGEALLSPLLLAAERSESNDVVQEDAVEEEFLLDQWFREKTVEETAQDEKLIMRMRGASRSARQRRNTTVLNDFYHAFDKQSDANQLGTETVEDFDAEMILCIPLPSQDCVNDEDDESDAL